MSLEGEICNFTCNSGYQLTGSNNRTCENGNWTGSEATCTRSKTTTKIVQPYTNIIIDIAVNF